MLRITNRTLILSLDSPLGRDLARLLIQALSQVPGADDASLKKLHANINSNEIENCAIPHKLLSPTLFDYSLTGGPIETGEYCVYQKELNIFAASSDFCEAYEDAQESIANQLHKLWEAGLIAPAPSKKPQKTGELVRMTADELRSSIAALGADDE